MLYKDVKIALQPRPFFPRRALSVPRTPASSPMHPASRFSPFVFIFLRIAFFSTPLFSMPSALPYVFSKSIPKKENHNDPPGL